MPDTMKSKLNLVGSGASSGAPSGPPPHPDMVWIPGGTFDMGSNDHYPEERPVHRVGVDGFWIDRYPVTNERFAASSRPRGTSPSRRSHRTRPTIRGRCPRCCTPARWCS